MFGMVTAIVVEPDPTFDPDLEPVRPTNWRPTAGPDHTHDEGAGQADAGGADQAGDS